MSGRALLGLGPGLGRCGERFQKAHARLDEARDRIIDGHLRRLAWRAVRSFAGSARHAIIDRRFFRRRGSLLLWRSGVRKLGVRLLAVEFLDDLQQALPAQFLETDLVRSGIEQAREQRALEAHGRPDALLDAGLGQHVDHLHGQGLAHAVNPANALLQTRGIPRWLEVDDRRGRLQVQAYPARIGREKDHALRIFAEPLHQRTSLRRRHSAMEGDEFDAEFSQHLPGEAGHALVFAEHYDLAALLERQFPNDLAELAELRRVIRFLVEQERRVAEHPHVLDAAHDAARVDLGEPTLAFPFAHQSGQDVVLLLVWLRLFGRERHPEDLVRALGQLLEHIGSSASQQDRFQPLVDQVQAAVSLQLALVVRFDMVLQEAEGRTKQAPVHELDDRVQFLELVLQGRAGQHKRVAALELLDRARRASLPVADALRLVENDQVRPQRLDLLQIVQHEFVVDQVEELGLFIEPVPATPLAIDDLH